MTRLSLEEGQIAAIGNGWLQERYYSSEGSTVGDFLCFQSVYEINPFEVGATHSKERKRYLARRGTVERLLEVVPLRDRPLASLSNGELRRVVLARCLLRESGIVTVEGGCGGLDPEWRRRIREVARVMRPFGVYLRIAVAASGRRGGERGRNGVKRTSAVGMADAWKGEPIVEVSHVCISFGRRTLFRDFSWVIREGERWVLRGPNGSGKTTLLALVTGDSPFAYACDVKVFGKRRGAEGEVLGDVRAGIGEVSSMRQSYLGLAPERQLDEALRPGVKLLLLDEPCCNMSMSQAGRFARRVTAWLRRHPRVAAVWVEHRSEVIPSVFSLVKRVGDF